MLAAGLSLSYPAAAQAQTFRVLNKLEVPGHSSLLSSAAVTGQVFVASSPVSGYVLRLSSGTGAAGQGLFYVSTNGYTGIGVASPQSRLHIAGGRLRLDNNADPANKGCFRYTGAALQYSNDCVSYSDFNAGSNNGWQDTGPVNLLNAADYVGIGTALPTHKLAVEGKMLVSTTMTVSGTGVTGSSLLLQVADSTFTVTASSKTGIGVGIPAPARLTFASTSTLSLPDLTEGVSKAGLLLLTVYTNTAYTPGLFWVTSNANPASPKGGVFLREIADTTNMYFGTSNSYVTGLTNAGALYLDASNRVGIQNTAPLQALDVTGNARASSGLRASAGTEYDPAYSFTLDKNTGFYNPAPDTLDFNLGGSLAMRVDPSNITTVQPWLTGPGSAAAPIFGFASDPNLGIYRPALNTTGITTAGTISLYILDGYIQGYETFNAALGTEQLPSISFSSNNGVGFYAPGTADTFAVSVSSAEMGRFSPLGMKLGQSTNAPEQPVDMDGTAQVRRTADALVGAQLRNSNQLPMQGAYWYFDGYSYYSVPFSMRLLNTMVNTSPLYRFSVQNDALTEVLSVLSNGNVGVNTISPAQRLYVAGNIRLSGSVMASIGDTANPSLTFTTDPDGGVYSAGPDMLDFTAGGLTLLSVRPDHFSVPQRWRAPDGLVGTPAYAFGSSSNTGIYRVGIDQLGFTSAGTLGLNLQTLNAVSSRLLAAVDGSPAAPALSFSSDLDTGLYGLAGSTLVFSAGGAERVRVDGDGNVGVGITSPQAPLDLAGELVVRRQAQATAGVPIRASNHLMFQGAYWTTVTNSAEMQLKTIVSSHTPLAYRLAVLDDAGNERLSLTSAGSLGISTGAPTQKLHVIGNVQVTDGSFYGIPGAAAAPSYAFSGDANQGFYNSAPDNLDLVVGGASPLRLYTDQIYTAQPWRGTGGTAAAPALSFTDSPGTGVRSMTANALSFSAAGADRFTIGAASAVASVPVRLEDGAAASPPFTFTGDTDSGLFLPAPGTLGFSVNGAVPVTLSGSVLEFTPELRGIAGSAADPAFSFSADTGDGLYSGTDILNLATNATLRFSASAAGLTYTLNTNLPQAAAALPAYSFTQDTDTGLFSPGDNVHAFTAGGSEKLRVDAVGVAVDTAAPAEQPLDVAGTVQVRRAADASPGAPFQSNYPLLFNGEYYNLARYTANMQLKTAWNTPALYRLAVLDNTGAERMSVMSNYRVGIGTGNPQDALEVYGGNARVSGAFLAGDGSQAVPAFTFAADDDTGFFTPAAGRLHLVTGGVSRLTVDSSSISASLPWRGPMGTVGAPAFSFSGNTNTGLYQSLVESIALVTAGTGKLTFTGADIVSLNQWRQPDGSQAAPAYSFTSDDNTGVYSSGADAFGFAANGADSLNIGPAGGGVTTPLRLRGTAGTLAAPAYAFSGDTDSGFRASAVDAVSFTADAGDRFTVGSSSAVLTVTLNGAYGSPAAPQYSFLDDADTGMYGSANNIYFSAGGAYRFRVGSSVYLEATLPWYGQNGAAGAPAYSFSGDTDAGLYSPGAGQLAFATGASPRLTIDGGSQLLSSVVLRSSGTEAAPSLSFEADPDTGLYPAAPEVFGLSAGGAKRMQVGTSSVSYTVGLYAPDGAAAAPAYGFTGDTDTGIYYAGPDQLAFSAGGADRLLVDAGAQVVTSLPWRGPGGTLAAPAYSFAGDTATGLRSLFSDGLAFTTSGTDKFTVAVSSIIAALPLYAPDGSLAEPAYSFSGDTNTGIYGAASGRLDLVTSGTGRMALDAAAITTTLPWRGPMGTLGAPAFSFSADADTGLYQAFVDTVTLVTAGTGKLTFTGADIVSLNQWRQPAGGAAAPAYSFTSDDNTGVYSSGADSFGFASGGLDKLNIGPAGGALVTPLLIRGQAGTMAAPAFSFTGDTASGARNMASDAFTLVTSGADRFTAAVSSAVFTLALKGADGAPGAPSYSFLGDNDTGLYGSSSVNQIYLSAGGASRLRINGATAILPAVPWRGQDGTAPSPAYSFSGDENTGLYYAGPGQLVMATAGAARVTLDGEAQVLSSVVLRSSGTAAAPAHSFTGDDNTGIYTAGPDIFGLAAGGARRMEVGTSSATFTVGLYAPDGAAAAPAYGFTGDTDTGIYYAGPDQLAFSAGGADRLLVDAGAQVVTSLPWRGPGGTLAAPAYSFAGDTGTGLRSLFSDGLAFTTSGTDKFTVAVSSIIAALPLYAPAGTLAEPAYSFSGDTNTGLYGAASGRLDLVTAGTGRMALDAAAITTTLPWRGPMGTLGAPAFSFSADADTGLYQAFVDTVTLVTAGTGKLTFTGADIVSLNQWRQPAGGAAAPAYSFTGDSDTGLYSAGADSLGFAAGGAEGLNIGGTGGFILTPLLLRAPAGAAALPAYAFSGDPDSGMRNMVSDAFTFSTDSGDRLTAAASSVTVTVPVTAPAGAAGAPSYSFLGDNDTGIYRGAASSIYFGTGGAYRLRITGALVLPAQPWHGQNGTAAAPAYAFAGDENTGLYRAAEDELAFSAGGALRLAIEGPDQVAPYVQMFSTGAASGPGYSFWDDPDTGFYGNGTDLVAVSAGGASRFDVGTASVTVPSQLLVPDGTPAAPGYAFSGDGNTGLMLGAAGRLDLVAAGAGRMALDAAAITTALPFRGQMGTAAAPALSFSADTNTGLYQAFVDTVTLVTAGTGKLTFTGTDIVAANPWLQPAGGAAAPAYSFTGDSDTGLYSAGADSLGFAAGGAEGLNIGGVMLTPLALRGSAGTAALPAYAFSGDPDSGMRNMVSDAFTFSTDSGDRLTAAASSVTLSVPYNTDPGLAAAPGYAFLGDNDTGLYSGAAENIGFSAGGVSRLNISDTVISPALPWHGQNGSLSAPAYSFSGDENTGLYRPGADQLAFVANGAAVLSLAGGTLATSTLVLRAAGTEALPAYSFEADPNTGLYLAAADSVAASAGGAKRFEVGTAAASLSVPLYVPAGLVSAPPYSFSSDLNTGLFMPAAGQLDLVSGGAYRFRVDGSDQIATTVQWTGQNGTAALPAYSFGADENTGLYRAGAEQLAASAGGAVKLTVNAAADIQPAVPLHVPDGSAGAPSFSFNGDTDTGLYMLAGGTLAFSTNGSARMVITGDTGNVGIGTLAPAYALELALDSAAKPGAGNTWTIFSDERLKKDIKPIASALDKLTGLRGVTYRWKDPASQGGMSGAYMGLIAQEAEKVFPEWVGTNSRGYKDLTVIGFHGLVPEALRELKQRNLALKERLRLQGERIARIKSELGAE